jgi:hypothetical protein
MHPRSLLVVEAPVVLDAVDEVAGVLDVLVLVLALDEALDELLPQAASSKHVLAAAAAAINAVCLTVSSSGPGLPELGITGRPSPRTDCPEIISYACRAVEGGPDCDHLVAKSRSDFTPGRMTGDKFGRRR